MNSPENTFFEQAAKVDAAAIKPLPNSRKIYITGSRPDIRVPQREIRLSATSTSMGGERNSPIQVYDTSGPYTDPSVTIDIRQGLNAVRENWVLERGDVERLEGVSSSFGRQRELDIATEHLRFAHRRAPM
ncbi:MAG: phosphomethylpyrimidine synthase ThiC, partial [Moraxellaceae bacterium]|nr:phosphomethylpyrimidine synthase ThiC [Moraxellaceae bacterium]